MYCWGLRPRMKFPSIDRRYGTGGSREPRPPNRPLGLANETERASLGGTNGGWIKREIAVMSTALGE